MILYFAILLTIVPILIGALVTYPIKKEYTQNLIFMYVAGFIAMIAMFQLLCIPFVIFKAKLHALVWSYSILLLILSVISLYIKRKKELKWLKKPEKISGFGIVAVLLICLQIVTSVGWNPDYVYSGDDTTYITMANDTVESDTIYLVDYLTGRGCTLSEVSPKYTLTSYIIFTSYLSYISGLHVLIICKTILPAFLIILAYMIWTLTGSYFLKHDKEKTAVFLILLSVINLFGAFSNYTPSFRLLVCIWQGKALMAVIVLPFLFYYATRIFQEGYQYGEILLLLLIMIAAAAGSVYGNGLAPIMLMGIALYVTISQKKCKVLVPAALCCIPNVVFVLIYMGYGMILNFIG